MFKLVVLSALLAFVAAAPAPGHLTGAHPIPVGWAGPAISSYSYSAAAPVAVHHAAPVAVHQAPIAYAAPVAVHHAAPVAVHHAAPVAVHHAPIAYAAPVATAITKTVHYESKPVVTGYSAQVLKPDLGVLATPAQIVTQQRVLAPARSVQTITPQITQVEPEVTIQKVAVDVPVHTPVVSEVEVRTPTVVAAPAIAYSAPAVHYTSAVHAAPVAVHAGHVAVHAAPAAVHYDNYAYGAAPALAYSAYGAAPAVAYKQW